MDRLGHALRSRRRDVTACRFDLDMLLELID